MAKRPEEFAGTIGDVQHKGSGTRIMALTRAPQIPNRPPINAAEVLAKAAGSLTSDRQVQSFFQTRPFDAYDFVLSANSKPLAGPPFDAPVLVAEFVLPVGYVAVLRRVELSFDPPYNGATIDVPAIARIMRTGSAIPANEIQLFNIVESYGWDTHHIFGYWERPGIQMVYQDAVGHGTGVRMIGTLIPATSVSPNREVGGKALLVQK